MSSGRSRTWESDGVARGRRSGRCRACAGGNSTGDRLGHRQRPVLGRRRSRRRSPGSTAGSGSVDGSRRRPRPDSREAHQGDQHEQPSARAPPTRHARTLLSGDPQPVPESQVGQRGPGGRSRRPGRCGSAGPRSSLLDHHAVDRHQRPQPRPVATASARSAATRRRPSSGRVAQPASRTPPHRHVVEGGVVVTRRHGGPRRRRRGPRDVSGRGRTATRPAPLEQHLGVDGEPPERARRLDARCERHRGRAAAARAP